MSMHTDPDNTDPLINLLDQLAENEVCLGGV